MMNLTARTPSFVSSSASSNPGRTSHGYQDPERPVLDDRTGQTLKCQDQTIYKRIMVYPGLLKSGKVEMENTIDQGNLMKILGIHCEKCRGNKPCTSYSRTNGYVKLRTNGYDIAYTFTHNNITLEHNAMNM